MNAVMTEVAAEAASLLAPFLTRGVASDGGPSAPGDPVNRLWSLLSGYPKVRSAAATGDEYLREDLTREIGRVLGHNGPLLARVRELVGQARLADPVRAAG
jgi:hypothetical protein